MAAAMFAAEINKQKGGGGGGGGIGGIGGKGGAPDMKKFERMKKMGLPLNSILNKMRMEGVDSAIIEQWGGKSSSKKKAVEEEKQIMPSSAKPSQKMKAFHWAKMSAHTAKSDKTIWKDAETEVPLLCDKIDFSEFDQLFSREADASARKQQSAAKKKRENQLIDGKRSQNVAIGLAQIKMSEEDLLDAILKMDDKVECVQ